MGAVDLLRMEPQIALPRLLGGKGVVLRIVLPHGDTKPCGGPELHGLGGRFHTGRRLGAPAEISRVCELLPDLHQIPLALRQRNGLQNAVQIFQLPAPFSICSPSTTSAVLALLYSL